MEMIKFIGTLTVDQTTGYEAFTANANSPVIYLSERECLKRGYTFYRYQCFKVKRGKIVERPIIIGADKLWYVYIESGEK